MYSQKNDTNVVGVTTRPIAGCISTSKRRRRLMSNESQVDSVIPGLRTAFLHRWSSTVYWIGMDRDGSTDWTLIGWICASVRIVSVPTRKPSTTNPNYLVLLGTTHHMYNKYAVTIYTQGNLHFYCKYCDPLFYHQPLGENVKQLAAFAPGGSAGSVASHSLSLPHWLSSWAMLGLRDIWRLRRPWFCLKKRKNSVNFIFIKF